MPYTVKKRKCKQSDGDAGSYVLSYTDKKGKKHAACHTSRKKAKGQIAAIEMPREADNSSDDKDTITLSEAELRHIIKEELKNSTMISEGLQYHIDHREGVDRNIFRPESESFFALFREVRNLTALGLYQLNENERELIEETDIGEWGIFEGERVPLDFPMLYEEDIDEAKYKGREVKLGAKGAKRSQGGKAYVYVRDPKTKKVKKVTFGSSLPDAMGDSKAHKERRKSFGRRHKCAEKDDKTKPGYWACRATKMFGRNIAGWW
jgi:hypothetical protein